MSENTSTMALSAISQRKEIQTVPLLGLHELQEIYAAIAEEQKATGGSVLYRIKIPTGGGKTFEVLTGDAESDTSLQVFSGVVVHHHRYSAYFAEDSSNQPPLCSSLDGERGVDSETGEARRCRDCPRNAYGTGKNGRGKACKNMHQLYIIAPGVAVPFVMSLPPTSIRSVQNYLLGVLAARQIKPWQVMTEFTLDSAQNPDGKKYSICRMRLLGRLDDADQAAADFFHEGFQAMAASQLMAEPEQEPSIDVIGDDRMPF